MSIGVFKFIVSVTFALVILKIILPARGVEQITIHELHKRLQDESVQFIDVRPSALYEQFHIFGFKNMPIRYLRQEAEKLDKDRPVVTICQTGAQGNRACKRLKRYGFTRLTNVQGGLSTWEPVQTNRD
ncbi:MAG TPA: rhodanese-like domain-containing protein [Pseudogracilibacillus sp.]|nr:rhodanese-like domain-containing protein [Pseudogracilibacillus sp.]